MNANSTVSGWWYSRESLLREARSSSACLNLQPRRTSERICTFCPRMRSQTFSLMRLTQIEVECYAGAKADETPRRFNLEGQTIELGEVLDRWYQVECKPEWPRADYFKV